MQAKAVEVDREIVKKLFQVIFPTRLINLVKRESTGSIRGRSY